MAGHNMPLFTEIITPNHMICSKEVALLEVNSMIDEMEILVEHRPIVVLLPVGSTRFKSLDGRI
jgi:F0F1-type ATP synthase epsilon subunit